MRYLGRLERVDELERRRPGHPQLVEQRHRLPAQGRLGQRHNRLPHRAPERVCWVGVCFCLGLGCVVVCVGVGLWGGGLVAFCVGLMVIVQIPVLPRDRLILFWVQYSSNTEDVYWQPRSDGYTPAAVGAMAAKGVGDQAGPHVRGDGPANYLPRVKIDDGREISPPVPCFYVGHVAAPAGISAGSGEVPADQVRGRDRRVPADGGPLPGSWMASAQASGLHQPVDALMRDQVAQGRQARAHPAHARVPPRVLVNLLHDRDQRGVVP